SYLCVFLESEDFRSFSSCATIDSRLTIMGPKPRRRVMTRGRNECSVELDAAKQPTRRGGRQKLTTKTQIRRLACAEPRAPIGKKFVHKSVSDASHSSHRKNGPIEEWMNNTAELGVRGVRKEFVRDIKGYVPSGSQSAWENDKNFDKNRYEDIRLLDKTRVIIKKAQNGDDYIHASYVKVADNLTYICAQGPLENTVQNFWIMVIQEESKVILQLCQMRENGKEQSAEYFPKNSTTKSYGAVHVHVKEKPTNAVGLKNVTRSKIQATYEGKTQEVLHILYTGWPDHCVADSPAVCCGVRNLVHKNYDKKPVIVHCSAGVGRTGTFVAIEMAVSKLKEKEITSICDLAKCLRDQRMGAIQNDQQYLFIYRMVIEVLMNEDLLTKDLQVINFLKDYEDIIQRKKAERMRKTKN
uniref:Protein-tyrosine-phosphatase n=2 Tax=Parascaris univalens TaxID=6257 RepID=A0A915ARR5_PARUN